MVLSASPVVTLNLISNTNPATIASNIASSFKEATPDKLAVLIATGLVLFVFTFAVNFAARWIVGPQRAEVRAMTTTDARPRAARTSLPLDARRGCRAGRPLLVAVVAVGAAGLPGPAARLGPHRPWRSLAAVLFLVGAAALVAAAVEGRRGGRRPADDRRWSGRPSRVALVPLVWLIWTVVEQRPRRRSTPSSSPTPCATSSATSRAASTTRSSAPCWSRWPRRSSRCPIGLFCRDLPRRVRQGQAAGPLDHLPGRRDDRHPVDRGRPVRARAVRADLRARDPARLRRLGRAVAADDPDRGALHRGDAAAGPRRPARGVVRPGRAEVAHDRQGRAARPRWAASSPA